MPEKQIKNRLTKPWLWKPGESGNKNGRPKGKVFSEIAREVLKAQELKVNYGKGKIEIKCTKNFYYTLIAILIDKALKGDILPVKVLLDRVEGKPLQGIRLNSPIIMGIKSFEPLKDLGLRGV